MPEKAEGNYIDEDDVTNWPDSSSTADRQEVIDGVEQLVEHITKDYFYAKSFNMKYNGNDKDRLFPILEQIILSVSEIYIDGVELASGEWDFDEDSVYTTGQKFTKGHNNINIIGTLGWTDCPLYIKKACIILCEVENDDTLHETYVFKSERLGEYSYTRGDTNYTGIPKVDEYLDRYINRRPTLATY